MSQEHLLSLGSWLKALEIIFRNRGFGTNKKGCKKYREKDIVSKF